MSDAPQLIYPFPARIEVRASDTALLDLAKQHARDASVFDRSAPYFWEARISNNRLDSWFTRMQSSSLKNYARDAQEGVPFQDSHKTDTQARTLGYSLTGQFHRVGDDT